MDITDDPSEIRPKKTHRLDGAFRAVVKNKVVDQLYQTPMATASRISGQHQLVCIIIICIHVRCSTTICIQFKS